MRFAAALFPIVTFVLVSRAAHADPKPPKEEDGFSFGPGLVIFQPNLASSVFNGSGVPTNSADGVAQTFDPAAAQAFSKSSSISAYGGGIHAVAALPLGPQAPITSSPDMGVRGFSVPLLGFEPTTCHNKYGSYSCPQTATSTQPYFQPRVAIIIHSDGGQGWSHVFIAPWIGMDVYPAASSATGIMLGLGENHNALR